MIKYSRQRESILNALAGRTDHPTAETIYNEIRETFPNISLGTVYRNLTFLSDLGKIQKISTENGPDRFDPNVEPHCHFTCSRCGAFSDFDFDCQKDLISQAAMIFPGKVDKCSIQFSGVCCDCLKGSAEQNN